MTLHVELIDDKAHFVVPYDVGLGTFDTPDFSELLLYASNMRSTSEQNAVAYIWVTNSRIAEVRGTDVILALPMLLGRRPSELGVCGAFGTKLASRGVDTLWRLLELSPQDLREGPSGLGSEDIRAVNFALQKWGLSLAHSAEEAERSHAVFDVIASVTGSR